jgi:hypothetical protein
MPTYTFIVANEPAAQWVELADDDAAWSALIVFAGELVREIDGQMKAGRPHEEGQEVAAAAFEARRRAR